MLDNRCRLLVGRGDSAPNPVEIRSSDYSACVQERERGRANSIARTEQDQQLVPRLGDREERTVEHPNGEHTTASRVDHAHARETVGEANSKQASAKPRRRVNGLLGARAEFTKPTKSPGVDEE
jgi:hypothetical protein